MATKKKAKKTEAEVQTPATDATETPAPTPEDVTEAEIVVEYELPKTRGEDEFHLWDTAKEPEKVKLPVGPDDLTWDFRMEKKIPKEMIQEFARDGILSPIQVFKNEDGTFGIINGRTRVRAVPEVNKLRAKLELPPLVLKLQVMDLKAGTGAGDALNAIVLKSDHMTIAKDLYQKVARGVTEEELAKKNGISVAKVTEYVTLLGLSKKGQDALMDGKITFAAAVELATNDPAKQDEKIQKLLASDTKVTKTALDKEAGKDVKARMSIKDARGFQETIKASKLKGDHGDFMKHAMIAALDVVDDPRKEDEFWSVLNNLCRGKLPKDEEQASPAKK
jgi:ParB-like chromosome segregation protein Spo0J